MKKNPAFVMNCHYNGLSIIRELGRHGVPVTAIDCIRSIGTSSRYAEFYKCPNPAEQETEFIRCIYDAAKWADEKPVLIPTNDVWAMALARHKKELQDVALLCVADEAVVDLLIDKISFNQWCIQNRFPVPIIWTISESDIVPADAFPIILKPISRRKSSDKKENIDIQKFYDKNRIIILNSKEELRDQISSLGVLSKKFFIQEFIPGLSDQMYTIGVYADQSHDVKGVFTGRKVRGYPADIGDCRLGQSQVLPDNLIDMSIDLCKKIGYFGIAEIEFKKDNQFGEYKLIEINPRSWSWVGITPYCGVSLPWMAYADLTGLEKPNFTVSKAGTGEVKYIRLLDDFVNCLIRYKKDGYPQWSLNFAEWMASIKSEKLVIAEFEKGDPFPLFIHYANKLFTLLKRCFRKMAKFISPE